MLIKNSKWLILIVVLVSGLSIILAGRMNRKQKISLSNLQVFRLFGAKFYLEDTEFRKAIDRNESYSISKDTLEKNSKVIEDSLKYKFVGMPTLRRLEYFGADGDIGVVCISNDETVCIFPTGLIISDAGIR